MKEPKHLEQKTNLTIKAARLDRLSHNFTGEADISKYPVVGEILTAEV